MQIGYRPQRDCNTYCCKSKAKGIDFLDWVERIYDPEKLEREFTPGLISS